MKSMFWQIPRLWEGSTVAVLASGPGMTELAAEAVRRAGIPAIAVNTTYQRAPWAAMLYAADGQWWQEYRGAPDFDGLKVTIGEPCGFPDVLVLRNAGAAGWTDDRDALVTMGNSGAQALQIAIKAGAARVLLVGFDMTRAHGAAHWHADHAPHMKSTHEDTYAVWRRRLKESAPEILRRADVAVVTPSALTCFRVSTLEAELSTTAHHAAAAPQEV